MGEFEVLLNKEKSSVERFVRFKINHKSDADDVIQEIFITAYNKFADLKSKGAFKSWIISIARNKCNDYFRKKAKLLEIPIETLTEKELLFNRFGIGEVLIVRDTIECLGVKDKQILYLYFWQCLPQAEIAMRLGIPIGTVKSRLHTAKQNFKLNYPYYTQVSKGESIMKRMPDFMPKYTITKNNQAPFEVRCEELQGLCIVPKLGEKVTWGLYDFDTKKCAEYSEVSVVGSISIHGIEGVEIESIQHDIKNNCVNERQYAAQLTDTHCRYLAEVHKENNLKKCITFLDGEIFMNNWGFGDDNCGNEVWLGSKGVIKRNENSITQTVDKEVTDIVGRYSVEICGKTYDTVCAIELGHFNNAVAIEMYIDENGRTILWRRFNRDDWAIDRYKKPWSEQLPENDRLIINGRIYVHWYDCITDYIF